MRFHFPGGTALGLAASTVLIWCLVVRYLMPLDISEDPTGANRRIREVERQSFAKSSAPTLVLLGTSRAAFGLEPRIIEEELHLPRMTVVNGGYPAMYDEALATLVSRNIDYLARAKLVVVVIDDYFGIQSSSRPSPQSRDGESGLLDAAQAFLPMLDDALDGYVAGIELRSQLYWTARNLRESLRLTKTASLWDLSETGRWSWPPIDQPRFAELPEYVAKSRALVDQYMSGKFSQRSVDIFEDTIARLTSRGIPVVAFDLPPALPYVEYRDLHYGPIASQRATAFQAIFARHGVTVLRCATSSACQLDESIYADPIHFNADGARRMSRAFAAILRDSGALNLSESP